MALYQPPTPTLSSLSAIFTAPASYISTDIPRLAINLEALDKCGKTHYALFTTPDPICLVTNDPGTVHVTKKAIAAGRRIPHILELDYNSPDPAITKTADVDKQEWSAWIKEWNRYKAGMKALEKDTSIRTLVRDTETDIWQLCMLSHFGKTQKIEQHMRTEANADYAKVFNDLYRARPDLNMVLIHKLKKQYVKNSKGNADWTGDYETSGMNQVAFHVDLSLKAGWDPQYKMMYTELTKPCRYGFSLVGKRWYGKDSHFGLLALEIFPETVLTPGLWGL
jgi:hypothetical protein